MQETGSIAALPPASDAERHPHSAGLLAYIAAVLLGVALAAWVFPLDFLLGRLDWLRPPQGDTAINIIAQRYFLEEGWHWPLLEIRQLDLHNGANLAFLDGIPLLALLLKLASSVLPPGFQGVDLWYAVAWVLQPVAAVWCLRGTSERRLLPALAIAVAAASMPVWWNRFGHVSLCSHFVLLMGLGCYLRLVARPDWRLWLGAATLELVALLLHPYLAMMVLALLAAAPLTLLLRGDLARTVPALAGFAATLAAFVAALVGLGYAGAAGGSDFGYYAMNLLSPVWPTAAALVPGEPGPISDSGGNWEGYNYLGVGLLLGLLAALLLQPAAVWRMTRAHAGLALALIGLAAFAASQRPMLGPYLLYEGGLVPLWLENLRSTGRFFWPVAYTLLVASIVLAARLRDRRVAMALVVAIAALQFADAGELRQGVRWTLARGDAAWSVDAARLRPLLAAHTSLTLLPSWHCVPGGDPTLDQRYLRETLLLGSETGIPASTMYAARWHDIPTCHDDRLASAPLGRGELRVLTPGAKAALLPLVPAASARCSPVGALTVCSDPGAALPPPTELPPPTPLAPGAFSFASGGNGLPLLGRGWSDPEPDGVWSDEAVAELWLQRPPELAGPVRLEFALLGFAPAEDAPQRVEVWSGGRKLERFTLQDRERRQPEVDLPAGPPGPLLLELRIAEPARPVDRGLSGDPRWLGVQLSSLRVRPAP